MFRKRASFIEAHLANLARNPPRVPRVVGRSLSEFSQNLGKFREKAPNFTAQADKAVESMRSVASQAAKPVTIPPRRSARTPHPPRKPFRVEMRAQSPLGIGSNFDSRRGVFLDSTNPLTAAHEMGHAVDHVDGILPTGDVSRKQLVDMEASATRRAFAANHVDPGTAAATGTYVQGGLPQPMQLYDIGTENALKHYGFTGQPSIASLDTARPLDLLARTRNDFHQQLTKLEGALGAQFAAAPSFSRRKEIARLYRSLPAVPSATELGGLDRRYPGLVPPEAQRLAAQQELLKRIIDRREGDAFEVERVVKLLANPVLNPKVAPQGAQLAPVEATRKKLHRTLSKTLSPEAARAADAFVQQQHAISAQDPAFAENLVRNRLRQLGIADEPVFQKLMAGSGQ